MSSERPPADDAGWAVPDLPEGPPSGFVPAYPAPGEYPGRVDPGPIDPAPTGGWPTAAWPTGAGPADPRPAGPSPYQIPHYASTAPGASTYPGVPTQPWAAQAPAPPPWAGYQAYPGGQPYAGGQAPAGAPPQWSTAPPPPLSGRPVAPPPSGRGWLAALIAVVGVVVLGLVVILVLPSGPGLTVPGLRPSGTPTSAATASARPSRTPTPKPTATMPTDQKARLKNNPIYALKVLANCPDQGRPSSKAAFRTQVKALMDCENTAWKKALSTTAVEFSKPKVEFYGSQAKSACGTLGSTFPAAYCSADRTMYFSTASYQQGRYYRLAVAQFVMHEYAHHIQQLADITPSSVALRESDALTSRRIELQAHCMAHYQLTHSNLGFDSLDRADAEYQFGYTNDPKGHGSVTAERYWGRRGMDGTTIGACNTWSVKPSKVT